MQAFDEAEDWVNERLPRILEGRCSTVAGGMRRSATRRKLSSKDRKPIDTCANYLLKYKRFLDYASAFADGLPIAFPSPCSATDVDDLGRVA